MNNFEEMLNGIRWVLDNCTSYQAAKDLGINNRTVNRYQNGETPLENMTLGTAEKLYNYYLKEMEVMGNNNVLKEELTRIVDGFCKEQKGYYCYQLDVERVDIHNLMTMCCIIESDASKAKKRTIIDGMTLRLQPYHWESMNNRKGYENDKRTSD